MTQYIFDVDGTLTPSRQIMDWRFEKWFKLFAQDNPVYLVSGSDRAKTLEQVGKPVYDACVRVYNCSGNDVWEGSKNIRSSTIEFTDELRNDLESLLNESKFYSKTGKHIDLRPGLINFSILGRGCTLEQRAMYKQWDEHKKEREYIVNKLTPKYSNLLFTIGGETGIDITERGKDKSQILRDFPNPKDIYFFGDKMEYGGNDYTLSLLVSHSGGKIKQVKDWQDTWKALKKLSE